MPAANKPIANSMPIARPAFAPPLMPPDEPDEDPVLAAAVLLGADELVDSMNDEVGDDAAAWEFGVVAAAADVASFLIGELVGVSLTDAFVFSGVDEGVL